MLTTRVQNKAADVNRKLKFKDAKPGTVSESFFLIMGSQI